MIGAVFASISKSNLPITLKLTCCALCSWGWQPYLSVNNVRSGLTMSEVDYMIIIRLNFNVHNAAVIFSHAF